ncbi:hypothetical protein ACFLXT_02325 [Chloroflexota bacterium]
MVLAVGDLLLRFVIQPALNTPSLMVIVTLQSLRAWCWIIAMLGLGSRFLNINNRFLGYASEAVLPYYILHQTIIIIIGFFVIQWSMGIAPKYIIVVLSSFVGIMAIYDLLVRRINVLRFLFGMRLRRKSD